MLNTKSALRSEFLKKRQELITEHADELVSEISESLLALLRERQIKVMHVYLPIEGKNEMNTWVIIDDIKRHLPEVKLVAPRVVPGTRKMEHFVLNAETILINNVWGIPEPGLASQAVSPFEIDAVLVPLLTFDEAGFRVGYGGGYYDRFLADCRPDVIKIGLSLFQPVAAIEDLDVYDVPMNYCITPERVWQW